MTNLKIQLPFVLIVNDYHDFNMVIELFKNLTGISLKYYEFESENNYTAVFYTGIRPKNYKEMPIKEWIW